MSVRTQVAQILHELFGVTADRLAHETGFVQRRQHKITGAAFAQALVFPWLGSAVARLRDLNAALSAAGVEVSLQAVAQRFNARAVDFLAALLAQALRVVVTGEVARLPVLERFTAVQLCDSSTIALPAEFADRWPGCGGGHSPGDGAAALKLSVCWDILSGTLCHLSLHAGRRHDRACLPAPQSLPRGALRLTDLGYFCLPALHELAAQGSYWVTRVQANTHLYHRGRRFSQAAFLAAHGPRQAGQTASWDVLLGATARVPARLIVERLPDDVVAQRRADLVAAARKKGQPVSPERLALAPYTILATNVPPQMLSVAEALAVYRVRWQIELLFKHWKSDGGLATSRSRNPQRILCEVYAKLLALVVEHWLLLLDNWRQPASSWRKAAAHVRHAAWAILAALDNLDRLLEVLDFTARLLAADTRISPRTQRPSTYQRLAEACGAVG